MIKTSKDFSFQKIVRRFFLTKKSSKKIFVRRSKMNEWQLDGNAGPPPA